jgi:hypothetical protein
MKKIVCILTLVGISNLHGMLTPAAGINFMVKREQQEQAPIMLRLENVRSARKKTIRPGEQKGDQEIEQEGGQEVSSVQDGKKDD